MTKRLVYGFLCFCLFMSLGLSSCTPSVEDSVEKPEGTRPMSEVQLPEASPAEPPTTTELSVSVQDAVLSAIATAQSLPPEQLTLQSARAESWPDSCLGLADPNELCAQMITPGWEIIVTDGQTIWTYRINDLGDQIRLAP